MWHSHKKYFKEKSSLKHWRAFRPIIDTPNELGNCFSQTKLHQFPWGQVTSLGQKKCGKNILETIFIFTRNLLSKPRPSTKASKSNLEMGRAVENKTLSRDCPSLSLQINLTILDSFIGRTNSQRMPGRGKREEKEIALPNLTRGKIFGKT